MSNYDLEEYFENDGTNEFLAVMMDPFSNTAPIPDEDPTSMILKKLKATINITCPAAGGKLLLMFNGNRKN